jgi:hypothetical protein
MPRLPGEEKNALVIPSEARDLLFEETLKKPNDLARNGGPANLPM